MTHAKSSAGEARPPSPDNTALRFQVYRISDDDGTHRTLVAAFIDYHDALEYAVEYINGDFTHSEVVSL